VPPVPTELRTERRDYLLVGWFSTPQPREAAIADDVCCDDATQLPAFIQRWVTREKSASATPMLWLAPKLREKFIEALAVMAARPNPPLGWYVPPASAGASITVRRDIFANPYIATVGGQHFGPDDDPDELVGLDSRAFAENLMAYDLPLDGELGVLAHLATQEDARRLLYAPRAGAGGYFYVVTPHDRKRRERLGKPVLQTLDGIDLVNPRRRVLPLPVEELVVFLRTYMGDQVEKGRPAHFWFPPDQQIAAWLREKAIQAPPSQPPPDAKLAERIEALIENTWDDKGHGLNQAQIVAKVRKRPATVATALEWLLGRGRIKLGPKGPQGQYEYLPARA